MAEDSTRLCEVCHQPVPAGQPPVRVGSCEFPFDVHEGCRGDMAPVAELVEELCVLSDEQPEGLVNLGGWSDHVAGQGGHVAGQGGGAVAGDAGGTDPDPALAFLDAYLDGTALPEPDPLSSENDAVYLHGWWPAAIRLQPNAYLVRSEPDPAGMGLTELVTDRLAHRRLRRCAVDDRLLESISLQRVGLLGGSWELWAADDEQAAAAVATAAAG